jgi:hypothetical protein
MGVLSGAGCGTSAMVGSATLGVTATEGVGTVGCESGDDAKVSELCVCEVGRAANLSTVAVGMVRVLEDCAAASNCLRVSIVNTKAATAAAARNALGRFLGAAGVAGGRPLERLSEASVSFAGRVG